MITFPKDKVRAYVHNKPHLTYGDGFIRYLRINRKRLSQEDLDFIERLKKEESTLRAKAMIDSRTDWNSKEPSNA